VVWSLAVVVLEAMLQLDAATVETFIKLNCGCKEQQ
jgi:hypothetical protein